MRFGNDHPETAPRPGAGHTTAAVELHRDAGNAGLVSDMVDAAASNPDRALPDWVLSDHDPEEALLSSRSASFSRVRRSFFSLESESLLRNAFTESSISCRRDSSMDESSRISW